MIHPSYIVVGVVSSLATFFVYPLVRTGKGLRFTGFEEDIVNWADALSLGTFACVGALSARQKKMHPIVVIICGMLTATFGGVIRDFLCQVEPWIFHSKSGLYACTALAGAIAYSSLVPWGPQAVAIAACIVTVVALRYASWTYALALPKFQHYRESVQKATECLNA